MPVAAMIIHRACPQQRAVPKRAIPMQGSAARGFSMLEVLIAVLVFSLGIVGLAGLLIFAIQSNHVAYLRTQATFLAQNMANRMGANPAGLWANAYNGNYPVAAASVSCASGCNPTELAAYDMQQWSTQLRTFLPNATGNITCGAGGITYAPSTGAGGDISLRPPYGGTCTMTLGWNEAGSATGAARQMQHFQWKFQP